MKSEPTQVNSVRISIATEVVPLVITGHRILRSLTAIILIVIGVTAVAVAQTERRLSPEPIDTALPSGMLTQSAARIGTKSLVAWGTTVGAGTIRNLIVTQLLENGRAVGSPVALSDSSSDLTGALCVFALR